jgi:PAS domain S-box-containing protein
MNSTTGINSQEFGHFVGHEQFQTLWENAPHGMAMLGHDGEISYMNRKFCELFGYDTGELPAVTEWFMRAYPSLFYRHLTLSGWISGLKSISPGTKKSYIGKVYCQDGSTKYINFIPVQLETDGTLMICEDITKNKLAEDRITQRNLELEALNDIITSINSSLHLDEILKILEKLFIQKLDIPMGGVFFYNELSNRISMETCWGISENMLDELNATAVRYFEDERVVHRKEVILEADNAYPIFSRYARARGFLFKWHSHLCVPLLVKDDLHGIILLIREAMDVFREEQIIFFRALGQQIGIAVQNARLFENVRDSHRQMQTLSHRLVEIQEAERRYIARELHDEIGQSLTGLKLALEMSERQSNETARLGIIEAQTLASKLMGIVRELSLNLRPAMLDDLGLLPTLLWHFERFTAQTEVRVIFRHTGLNSRFPRELETAVYRIIQEALTNVARHAKVGEVTVRLWSDRGILGVQIEDFGVGFDVYDVKDAANSSGLKGMRERVELLSGQFTVEAASGSGTKLTAELPIE